MSRDQFSIGRADSQDADAIAAMQVAMALETENLPLDPHTVMRGVQRLFGEPDRGFYLVAKDPEGDVVACLLVLKEWSDWRNADVWWIHSVYVAPAHRGRGLFRRVFQEVELLARAAGVAGLRLYVEKGNRRAQAVYRRLGLSAEHYLMFEKML